MAQYTLTTKDRLLGAEKLRYEAGWAYLDGRTKRAKQLNGKADQLDREARESVFPAHAGLNRHQSGCA
jgi:hypothetical protein